MSLFHLILLLPVAVFGSDETAVKWTLDAAIRQALSVHPDTEVARAQLEASRAQIQLSQAYRLPQLTGRLSYMQTDNPMQAFGSILNQGTFDNSIDFNHPGQVDALTATLGARYRLYSGGANSAQVDRAKSAAAAQEETLQATEASLSEAVTDAYFRIRQSREVYQAVKASIDALEASLRISRVREDAGDLLKVERLHLEVELSGLQNQLLAIQHDRRLASAQFAVLIGFSAASEITLNPDDASADALTVPERLSIEQRAELRATRQMATAVEEEITISRSGNLPSVDAFADWQYDEGWRREGDGNHWTAGLVVTVPIFDGFSTRANVVEARARHRTAEARVRQLRQQLELELEQARLDYELARSQQQTARQQVEYATEAATLSREQFAAGTLLSTELIGAESRLTRARAQLAVAIANERSSLAHLRRVVGLPILP